MSELRIVADLMAIAARTAPKAHGKDFIAVQVLEGADLQALAQAMLDYGQSSGKVNFDRDGRNVAASDSVVLIGLKNGAKLGLDCGACGEEGCADLEVNSVELEFSGPQCVMRVLDMGIALGSAVKTASMLNADSRIMYRVGVVARQLGLIDADVVMGIPLSATGKSPYFDRG